MRASKIGDLVITALPVILALAVFAVEPTACLWLLAIPIAMALGISLMLKLWNWRRPSVALRVRRFMRSLAGEAKERVGSSSVRQHWGSLSNPRRLVIRIVVASDEDRELLVSGGIQGEFDRLLAEFGLPGGDAGTQLTVDSQETVDRDFEGSWFRYDK